MRAIGLRNGLRRIVHVEFDRARGGLPAHHFFPLQLHVGVDLVGAEAAFRYGGMVNWQLQYVKKRDAIPMTRDYMYEEAERLRASEEPPEWHLSRAAE